MAARALRQNDASSGRRGFPRLPAPVREPDMQTRMFRLAAPMCAATFSLVTTVAFAQDADSSAAMDTVIVTAQRLAEQLEAERALTPGSVTLVDGDELHGRSVTNLADVLR